MSEPSTTSFPPSPQIRLPYPGYRVARATTREELVAVAHRRYQVFVEKMAAFPRNRLCLEIDAFDLHAEHFYASVDGVVVGSLRVVRDMGGGFPMETDGADVSPVVPRSFAAEGGRFSAEHIGDLNVGGDLLAEGRNWSLENGITHWVGVNNARSVRHLRRQGWPLVCTGEGIDHAGSPYLPHYVELALVTPGVPCSDGEPSPLLLGAAAPAGPQSVGRGYGRPGSCKGKS